MLLIVSEILLHALPAVGRPASLRPISIPASPARSAAAGVLRLDPGPVRHLVAEPGELALGVAAGVALRRARWPRRGRSRPRYGRAAGHAMRAHRRQRRVEPAPASARDLLERPAREHGVKARVDAPAQRVAVGGEEELPHAHARSSGPGRRGRRNDASGRPVASRTSSARRMRSRSPGAGAPRSRDRAPASRRAARGVARPRARAAPRSRTSGGTGGMSRQALGQRLEIEPGAADEDRQPPSARLGQERRRGVAPVAADRIVPAASTWP